MLTISTTSKVNVFSNVDLSVDFTNFTLFLSINFSYVSGRRITPILPLSISIFLGIPPVYFNNSFISVCVNNLVVDSTCSSKNVTVAVFVPIKSFNTVISPLFSIKTPNKLVDKINLPSCLL